MMTHPLQSEALARSIIEDRHRVPVDAAGSRRALRRTAGSVLLGGGALLERAGRSLQGADRRPVARIDRVELRPCS